jgi:Fe-S oxidoreductase
MKELPEDKKKKALRVFQSNGSSKLLTQLNSCVRCGLCAESCIYYLAYGDERFIPARKVDAVSSIYRRYCTFTGRTFPWLTGAKSLTEESVQEMKDLLFGSCTVCGRCVPNCSIGLDISYLVHKGREMLAGMGEVPESLQHSLDIAIDTGNNMGIAREDFIETLKWLEEDLRLEVNDEKASIPLDERGKNILYTLNPREPKFFPLSISAMAKIFYAAGESWTISSRMYDVTNYGYFTGDEEFAGRIAERMYEEICHLEVGTCVLAECGHGSRAFRWEAPNYLKRTFCFDVLTSVELIATYLRQGRIKLDPSKIKEKVTLHDPCNLVRNGGIIEEQRYILRHAVSDFVEMTPHGTENFCCGGGGGQLAMGEYNDRRLKVASIKAEQIRNTGAKIVCSPCHNCVDQLTQTSQAYQLGVKVVTLAELVADSLILEHPNT